MAIFWIPFVEMVLIHKKGVFSGFGSLEMVLIHKKGGFSGFGSLEMGVWVEEGSALLSWFV